MPPRKKKGDKVLQGKSAAKASQNGIGARIPEKVAPTVDKVIAEKRKYLSKLSEDYDDVVVTNAAALDSDIENKVCHATFFKLLAEIEVLKSIEPEILPNDPDFHYEYGKYSLKKEVENLEESLEKLTEAKKKLLKEEQLLIEKLKDNNPVSDEDSYMDPLEEQQKNSQLLQCLHRKLTKRLRQLARSRFSSSSFSSDGLGESTISSDANSQKSFYRVLKAFFVELQDRSSSVLDCEDPLVSADDSFPIEHLMFLTDLDLIGSVGEDSRIFRLQQLFV